LSLKVGSVTDPVVDRIGTLSIEQLYALGDALLNFGVIDDLTTWLDNQG
jgi:Domain of unknown function (DUF4351)